MVQERYSVNIYFLVVFDINQLIWMSGCGGQGFPLSQQSYLFTLQFYVAVYTTDITVATCCYSAYNNFKWFEMRINHGDS